MNQKEQGENMISFLMGVIEEKRENVVVMNVNGVGYELNISSNTLSSVCVGDVTKVHTYMAVREDDVSLYGFATLEERDLFYKLISVNGVGPKMAVTILSGMSISSLSIAIANKDIKLLSKIKGLGAKTAERICLELKDKVSAFPILEGDAPENFNEDEVQMATDTLIALGINKSEAYMLARSNAGENATAEEIIAKSLRGRG